MRLVAAIRRNESSHLSVTVGLALLSADVRDAGALRAVSLSCRLSGTAGGAVAGIACEGGVEEGQDATVELSVVGRTEERMSFAPERQKLERMIASIPRTVRREALT